MTTVEHLTHELSVYGADRDHHTLCSGQAVTVHHFNRPVWAVVVDGRVYRAESTAIREATS